MNETLEYVPTFAQFPFALRRFLKQRLTLEEAKQIVRERMEQREENFLSVVARSIYGYPHSPYLALLKMAGCELGDLRALVKQKGLEGALRELREEGVYVTFEEFKGRQPIVRNGLEIQVTARDFDNPFARRHYTLQSGGSTGLANNVQQDLDQVAAGAPNHLLMLAAHNVLDIPMAQCTQILPGAGFHFVLQRAYLAQPVDYWFSPGGWRDSKYWFKYSLASLYMILCLRLNGVRVPFPMTGNSDQILLMARWVRATLNARGHCLVYSNVSHALRICIAAGQAGFDLRGATFRVGGEPLTPAKSETLQRAGVKWIVAYGSIEANGIGLGCAQPNSENDVHLSKDAYALFTYPHTIPNFQITVPAFNLTTLRNSAPKILLNFQSDDYGNLDERSCGCPLEEHGYTTHLSEIRTYSKLVGEGITLIGNELIRILDDILPARFGGSPLDYQLAEQEDAEGFTRLYLIISQRVSIANEAEVINTVLQALRDSSPMADAARVVWQQAQTIRIKRAEPLVTARGKLLPLHLERNAKSI